MLSSGYTAEAADGESARRPLLRLGERTVLLARDGSQAESTRGATLSPRFGCHCTLDRGNDMTSRRTLRLLLGLGTTVLTGGPAVAQSMAYSDADAPRRFTLASAYHLRLESAWPQDAAGGEGCPNGGGEIVEGDLQRGVDGVYRGSFERRTLLLFCGAHVASGEACELVLEGDGNVAMRGYVVPDETSPSGSALRLSWRPLPGHGATVRGACSADFKRSVEEMYLSVSHGVELAVPAAGAERRKERLENYAWTAEVEGR